MSNVPVPILAYRKGHGLEIRQFQLFRLFPVLLTIMIMWGLCGILTATDVFPPSHPSRTDVRLNVLTSAKWFYVPYPGQFGWPSVTLSGVLGMLAGVLACTVESLSYYPTVSQMSGAHSPPLHAINRGIGTEGLGTVLAGLWGAGNGTNTFGENVGAIGVTKVIYIKENTKIEVDGNINICILDWIPTCNTVGCLDNGPPGGNWKVWSHFHSHSRLGGGRNLLCDVWHDYSFWTIHLAVCGSAIRKESLHIGALNIFPDGIVPLDAEEPWSY